MSKTFINRHAAAWRWVADPDRILAWHIWNLHAAALGQSAEHDQILPIIGRFSVAIGTCQFRLGPMLRFWGHSETKVSEVPGNFVTLIKIPVTARYIHTNRNQLAATPKAYQCLTMPQVHLQRIVSSKLRMVCIFNFDCEWSQTCSETSMSQTHPATAAPVLLACPPVFSSSTCLNPHLLSCISPSLLHTSPVLWRCQLPCDGIWPTAQLSIACGQPPLLLHAHILNLAVFLPTLPYCSRLLSLACQSFTCPGPAISPVIVLLQCST